VLRRRAFQVASASQLEQPLADPAGRSSREFVEGLDWRRQLEQLAQREAQFKAED
jgi:hypothetical protein